MPTCANSTRRTTCIPSYADDESAMLKRLRRDIDVQIVTTPILDPRTGREREVVDAFTLSYDNRRAGEGAEGRAMAGRGVPRRAPPPAPGSRVERRGVLFEGSRAPAHARCQARVQARGLQACELRPAPRAHRSEHVDDGSRREPARREQYADGQPAPGAGVPRGAARDSAFAGSGCRQRAAARGSIQPHALVV